MNIGRHNYDEYFILYMDNELGADERRAVEVFVQQHPDLKDELDILLQYKLVPDTNIVFDGKEELMKMNGDTPVTMSNYDEWIVLYMDNELSVKQKNTVEQFIAANPSLEKEFSLLQQTRLQPETVVFDGKASLYRKEEKDRPVYWWRIAAAAVLLFGIGIATVVVINNKKAGEVAKTTEPGKTPSIQTPVVVPQAPEQLVKENIVARNDEQVAVKKAVPSIDNRNIAIEQKKNTIAKEKLPVIIPQDIKEEERIVVFKPTNDLPQPLNNPNVIKNNATDIAIAKNIPSQVKNDALTNRNVTTNNPQPSDIVNVSYPTKDDAGLDQSDSKKNKSRGLFRKIARTFEKRTSMDPTDDNRLLVAGLAIKLK